MTARRLRVCGRVQGVGYRAWFAAEAGAAGLVGWVRNRQDGTVEALIKGAEAAVAAMIRAAHQGPPSARVDGVETAPAAGVTAARFEIKPTV